MTLLTKNKKNLETLIKIMSDYIPNNHFTYNGKSIKNNINFTNSNDLSKIYYKSSSLNQFIKEIKDGKYDFKLSQYNKSCIKRIYNNISDSKCMSYESYINNENIKINIINKSLNINPQITKFSVNDNNYDIIIEDTQNEIKKIDELTYLGVIAAALSSTIKSQKIKEEIVSKFLKLYDKNI